jgi:hypothetical protein
MLVFLRSKSVESVVLSINLEVVLVVVLLFVNVSL